MQVAYAHFRQRLQVLAHYRVELLVWQLLGALQLLVYFSVWSSVAESSGGSVNGYTAEGFAAYYLTLLIVRRAQLPAIVWKLAGEVQRGEFDARLLRPYHPAMAIHTGELGHILMGLANYLAFGIPIAYLAHASFDGSLGAMLAALALLPLVIAVRYLMDSILATLTFSHTRIEGFRAMYLILVVFLGGQFAPIGLVPGWFADVAHVLPFYWILGFPAELFIGRAELSEAITGALVLAAWTAVLYVGFRVAWSRGLRKLETVGT